MSDDFLHPETCRCEGCEMTGKAGRHRTKLESERQAELSALRATVSTLTAERDMVKLQAEQHAKLSGTHLLEEIDRRVELEKEVRDMKVRYAAEQERRELSDAERDSYRERLAARESEVSRMRDVIRETEHERELLERYKRDLDEIGRVMGCDHKDDGYLRCVTDELANVERLESQLAEARRVIGEIATHGDDDHECGHSRVEYCLGDISKAAASFLARSGGG